MFGDLMGMMGKLKETQEKVKATKERLNSVILEEKSSDNLLSVTITANRTLKAININDQSACRTRSNWRIIWSLP